MKLENILSKFLPASISPKSVERFANNIETFGKIIAGLLAIFYVVGLLIFGLYHSNLHIRSIELLQVRYLFVGFYYLAFLFLHLAFPVWWLRRIWVRIIYFILLLTWVIFLNPIHNTYLTYLFDKRTSGTSYFVFKPDHLAILNSNLSVLILLFLSSVAAIFFSVVLFKVGKLRTVAIIFIVAALSYNYQLFRDNVFPFIPDGIGGGQSPIVHIVFTDDLPDEVKSNFDLAGQVSGFTGDYYYGKLVFVDHDSVFLKEPFWYSTRVYEIQRQDIFLLEYTDYNPAEMGQPGVSP
jgi:hypothetical protein